MAERAGEALARAAGDALAVLPLTGGVHQGSATRAAFPHAVVETGPERDWSVKDRPGREARIAVTIADKGVEPARVHALMAAAEAAVQTIAGMPDWEIATIRFVRSQTSRGDGGWTGRLEFRARMLSSAAA